MSWSYNSARTIARDEVRFLIGDTDTTDQLLTNEDLDYLLTKNSNKVIRTGWRACEAIVAALSKRYNESIGPLNDDNPTKWQQYNDLALILQKRSIKEEGTTGLRRMGPPKATGLGETYLGPKDGLKEFDPTRQIYI